MRYRMRGKLIHRTLLLSLCWWLILNSNFSPGEARTGKLSTTLATTTPTPTTTIKPTVAKRTRKIRRRNRVLQKRNGGLVEQTGDYEDELDREPLYDAPAGYDGQQYDPPAHYYSPSKVQKQRKRARAQLNHQDQDQRLVQNDPSGPSQYLRAAQYSRPSQYSSPNQPEAHHFENGFQEQPAPKNYAFAYAVRDDNNAEDFSHKEARDGKLTMGEYRINLPDGRTQVVRYTAGGKLGYKADVTYEEDDPRNKLLTKPVRPKNTGPTPGPPYYQSPTSSVHKKYAPLPGPTHFDTPTPTKGYDEHTGQQFQRPIKSHRPSLSPSSTYSGFSDGSQDHRLTGSASPSPSFEYKAGPHRPRSSPPTLPSYYNGLSPTSTGRPKSIYDKIPRKKKPKYNGNLSFLHEQSPRAGPTRSKNYEYNQQIEASPSRENIYPAEQPEQPERVYGGPLKYYSNGPTISTPSKNSVSSGYNFRSKPLKTRPSKSSYFESSHVGPNTFIQVNPTQSGKGSLIPIEHFKAGPSRKKLLRVKNKQPVYDTQHEVHSYPQSEPISQNQNYRKKNSNQPSGQQVYEPSFNSPSSVTYKEPYHYYNSQHASYHHGGYVEPTQPPHNSGGYNQNQINPTGSSYSIDYPGGKQSFYLKTSVGKPKNGRFGRKKTSSGLVYLETPGEGQRPSEIGVKEEMARLPNMPPHSTSIHPYEVGSKDYGHSVGYKNTGVDSYSHSNDYGDEHLAHLNGNQFDGDHNHHEGNSYNRDYLIDTRQDSIVQVPMDSSLVEGVEQAADAAFQFDVK